MSITLNANDDPCARATDLINPVKTATVHGDVEMVETYHAPAARTADAVMAYWMERAAQRGREWRASPRCPKPLPHVAALMAMFPAALTSNPEPVSP